MAYMNNARQNKDSWWDITQKSFASVLVELENSLGYC